MAKTRAHHSNTSKIILIAIIILSCTLIAISYCLRTLTPPDCEKNTPNQTSQSIDALFAVDTIPAIYLTSDLTTPDRHNYSPATAQIVDTGAPSNNTDILPASIRSRGNSTYNYATVFDGPMPYKIKLDQKTSLLGMRAHKKWNLLANYYDRSYVKQFIAFGTANAIYGQDNFQPQAKYVEVFYNGEYRGLYLLTESIEEDDGALDIETNLTNQTENIPFLLEVRNIYTANHHVENGDTTLRSQFESNFFYGNSDIASPYWLFDSDPTNDQLMHPQIYSLKYPESFQVISLAQAANVKQSIRTLHAAVAAQAPLSTLGIDTDSFVNSWIFCELFMNMSCYNGDSHYLHRTIDSQIVAGPLWDFDRALVATNLAGFYSHDQNALMQDLVANPEFSSLLTSRYQDLYTNVLPLIEQKIISLKDNQILKQAVQKAEAKYHTWHISLANHPGYDVPDYPDARTLEITSYEDHIDYLHQKLFHGDGDSPSRADWIYQNLANWGNNNPAE